MLEGMHEAKHEGTYRRIEAIIGWLADAKRKPTLEDAAEVAEALVSIRTYFFAEAGKAEVLTKGAIAKPSTPKAVGCWWRSR